MSVLVKHGLGPLLLHSGQVGLAVGLCIDSLGVGDIRVIVNCLETRQVAQRCANQLAVIGDILSQLECSLVSLLCVEVGFQFHVVPRLDFHI